MKLVVIGVGQCGGRIADEFARINIRAHQMRGIDILVSALAVNTDTVDLAGITTIKPDPRHRILIGAGATHGHGTAKLSDLGAEIVRKDGDKVIDALRVNPHLQEADAFLLIGATAGGTGSGGVPVLARMLKERFADMPVYVMAVLPFEHEENAEERAVINTAVGLKSAGSIADAVILVENQRYMQKEASTRNNLAQINKLIVEPFFDLMCAGEEKRPANIGAKVMDAGDIIQTLSGWSAIGYGQVLKPLITIPSDYSLEFGNRSAKNAEGMYAMDQAVAELSVGADPAEAHRALFLLAGPYRDLGINLIHELSGYLKSICPAAVIRSGDYPREKGLLDVTLVLSEFGDIDIVRRYYQKSAGLVEKYMARRTEREAKLEKESDAARDVPTLL